MKYTPLQQVIGITCLWALGAHGQTPATVRLIIDTQNTVFYVDDATDFAKLAANGVVSPPAAARNFTRSMNIGDIVSINGAPARGSATGQFANLLMRTSPTSGQAIADVPSGSLAQWTYTIQTATGDPVGSILIQGLGFAPKPPGSADAALAGDFAVIGGTGAFSAVRGQATFAPLTPGGRTASAVEDPANRRTLGGGSYRLFLDLIADHRPEVIQTPAGLAIVHQNGSLVTTDNPAKSGEVLSAYVTGLGPTNAPLDPGQTFTSGELRQVTSPIQMFLNGSAATVIWAGGYPGTSDSYQLNFQVPAGLGKGPAILRWSVAWIPGLDATIPVQ